MTAVIASPMSSSEAKAMLQTGEKTSLKYLCKIRLNTVIVLCQTLVLYIYI